MLALARQYGLKGERMPNFGQLRSIPRELMQRLNAAYDEARNQRTAKAR